MIRRLSSRLAPVLAAGLALLTAPVCLAAEPHIERAIVLMRHGVRAPIIGEAPEATRTLGAWPKWPAAPEMLTPHGIEAIRVLGQADRAWFAAHGLLPAKACPDTKQVVVRSNTAGRTIVTGEAYLNGLAPGCGLAVDHLPSGQTDVLFEPMNQLPASFDAKRAIADINAYNGGMDALVARHARALAKLDEVLGCGGACSPRNPAQVSAGADGRGISLQGPIRDASGTAQVLMLEYLEGLPMAQVGWGRADARTLEDLGAVHAALFDVFSHPPYMAAFQTAPTIKRILSDLSSSDAPTLDVLVGHDTNVAALAALLGVTVKAPGFAAGDPSPGGALVLALMRLSNGDQGVRVYYRSQSAEAIRAGRGRTHWQVLVMPACHQGADNLCPFADFKALVEAGTKVAATSPN